MESNSKTGTAGRNVDVDIDRLQTTVVIIGAGPAGITAAYELTRAGTDCIVIEKEQQIGGISKTVEYKGFRFDLGGHRFYTKNHLVKAIWHGALGSNFLKRQRKSRIYYNGKFFDYPLRAGNVLKGLGLWNALAIIVSYFYAKAFAPPKEDTFEEWITKRFGSRLFNTFFKSYTEKLWGMPCSEIRAEWAAQRIKELSLLKAVKHALAGQIDPQRNQVKSLISSFHYPRLGPGMMWEAMAATIADQGGRILLGTQLTAIRHQQGRIVAIEAERQGGKLAIRGDHFISTIALADLVDKTWPPAPVKVVSAARCLKYRDFITISLILNKAETFPDNWIYVHDPSVRLARIQNYKNWSPDMVPDPLLTCLGLEYFCFEGDRLWRMTDEQLVALAASELSMLGIASIADVVDGKVIRVGKAYPVYDSVYADTLSVIKGFVAQFANLQTIGRNGTHRYNNMDHSMLSAICAVQNLAGKEWQLWQVNEDQEYLEEERCQRSELISDEAVINAFRRLDKFGFATGVAVVWSLFTFVAICLIQYHGEDFGRQQLLFFGQIFPGYVPGSRGAIIGWAYTFLWGFLFGWFFSYLRNFCFSVYIFNIKRKSNMFTINDFFYHFN